MRKNHVIRSVFGKGSWMFVLMAVFFLIALVYEKKTTVDFYTEEDIQSFQKTLITKEKRIEDILVLVQEKSRKGDRESLFAGLPSYVYDLYRKEGLAVYVYCGDSLCFWNDNSVPVPERTEDIPVSTIDQIGNSIFLKKEMTIAASDSLAADSLHFVGLVLIKTIYPYENRFIHNGFQSDFSISSAVKIRNSAPRFRNPVPGQGFPVYDQSGQYLFSLDPDSAGKSRQPQIAVCLVLYLLTFFLFLLFFRRFIRNAPAGIRNYLIILAVPVLIGFYYLITHFRLPSLVFDLELFSPDLFARSALLSSLGDLLLITIIGFFLIHSYYMDFRLSSSSVKKTGPTAILFLLFSVILAISLYLLNAFVMKSIVIDSTISFETYKVMALTIYTFIGLLILALQFTAFALVVDKVFSLFEYVHNRRMAMYFMFMLIVSICLVLVLRVKLTVSPETTFFYSLMVFLLYYFRFGNQVRYRFSTFLIYVLLFSVFSVFEITRYSEQKSRDEMKMMAVNLSAEHDPVAELLFPHIDSTLRRDDEIRDMLFDPYFNFQNSIPIFSENTSVVFGISMICRSRPAALSTVCMLLPRRAGITIAIISFMNMYSGTAYRCRTPIFSISIISTGRISYFGALTFDDGKGQEVTLFIELDSRLISEGLGYPELLLEDGYTDNPMNFHGRNTTGAGSSQVQEILPIPCRARLYAGEKEGFEPDPA